MLAEDPEMYRLRQKEHDRKWEAGKAEREIEGTF
jgi:hypothetical protein